MYFGGVIRAPAVGAIGTRDAFFSRRLRSFLDQKRDIIMEFTGTNRGYVKQSLKLALRLIFRFFVYK